MALPTQRPSMLRLTIILGCLAAFGPLSIDMYLPSLPTLVQEFRTDTAAVQLTLSIFFIGLAFGQALYGPIAGRFGRCGPAGRAARSARILRQPSRSWRRSRPHWLASHVKQTRRRSWCGDAMDCSRD